ncbi:serine hydrolase domain-containing protein [Nioella nitratireducens]|uniref:serine hydrolase domain-containing protein n=1 Tax=Nioella nitratireducens TaxID=1287720 RepID=UPI0008FD40AA|nr:serine hydrolase [Nioella nitratireducens]
MRRALRIGLRGFLLILVLALAAGIWKREEIERLLAVNSLFDADRIVQNFSHMDRAFLTAPVPRGDGPISPLPQGTPADLPPEVAAWIEERAITGLVVLQDGEIRYEDYFLGTGAEDRRISWSMAKSFLSALLGTLVADGTIADLDTQVTEYAPLLSGSAYDGATIRNVLNMASGVRFDEDYLDYNSDINRMGRVVALGGALDQFAADLQVRDHAPGEVWQYVSIDTHVLGMVIRGATGRSIPDLLSERIIQPMGLESQPYYITDGDGVAFVLGGLNMMTRDYARMGQAFLQNGRYNDQQIVPTDWVAESTAPSAPTAPGQTRYGYQWWIPVGAEPGQFMAQGVYGQYIYVDQVNDVVIAVNAADRGFREEGVGAGNLRIFRAIAESL